MHVPSRLGENTILHRVWKQLTHTVSDPEAQCLTIPCHARRRSKHFENEAKINHAATDEKYTRGAAIWCTGPVPMPRVQHQYASAHSACIADSQCAPARDSSCLRSTRYPHRASPAIRDTQLPGRMRASHYSAVPEYTPETEDANPELRA